MVSVEPTLEVDPPPPQAGKRATTIATANGRNAIRRPMDFDAPESAGNPRSKMVPIRFLLLGQAVAWIPTLPVSFYRSTSMPHCQGGRLSVGNLLAGVAIVVS